MSILPQERPLERLYLQAVRGELEEPAIHEPRRPLNAIPTAGPVVPAAPSSQPTPEAARQPLPPTPPVAPGRPGEGDTLLNELLRRDGGTNGPTDER
jgi:hypothetical protein